jgi:hypothetical protein
MIDVAKPIMVQDYGKALDTIDAMIKELDEFDWFGPPLRDSCERLMKSHLLYEKAYIYLLLGQVDQAITSLDRLIVGAVGEDAYEDEQDQDLDYGDDDESEPEESLIFNNFKAGNKIRSTQSWTAPLSRHGWGIENDYEFEELIENAYWMRIAIAAALDDKPTLYNAMTSLRSRCPTPSVLRFCTSLEREHAENLISLSGFKGGKEKLQEFINRMEYLGQKHIPGTTLAMHSGYAITGFEGKLRCLEVNLAALSTFSDNPWAKAFWKYAVKGLKPLAEDIPFVPEDEYTKILDSIATH